MAIDRPLAGYPRLEDMDRGRCCVDDAKRISVSTFQPRPRPSSTPTSPKGHLQTIIIVMMFAVGHVSAVGWDDFANNLGIDLAPLIMLFGEQVTKQYLGDSFGWIDNLIFALAPLGIITAMVGAVRVGGRAQSCGHLSVERKKVVVLWKPT
ncbi:hypothetical protein BZA05DRAFT_396634 [Tricharina praecox]|uniref:uncharacterized protein n=1 Tax=Tricharina praecox TaxID=43433 RepID=UPI00221E5841|nr:uncharacterized protein BZA05DRAFT_396634 [Tricharina praecox]KAI5853605.1 hypothetical protein BZA05DRAFT_396634 [Tricharina praecox]